jgi:hypothetical protein
VKRFRVFVRHFNEADAPVTTCDQEQRSQALKKQMTAQGHQA